MNYVSQAKPDTRNTQLDTLKGLLIFLVVAGHMIESFQAHGWLVRIYKFIYLFHMPAFIFISGMLTPHTLDAKHARKLITHILVPLIVFEGLYALLFWLLHGHLPGSIYQLAPHWILWFFLSLMTWRLVAPLLAKLRYPLACSIIIALIGLSSKHSGYYLSLARSFSFLPFFVAGLIHGQQIMRLLGQQQSRICKLVAILMLLILFVITGYLDTSMLFGSVSLQHMPIDFSIAIVLRIMTWILSFAAIGAIIELVSGWQRLSQWGQQSMIIYVWHGMVFMLLREVVNWPSMNHRQGLALLASIIIAWDLCRLLASQSMNNLTKALLAPAQRLIVKP